MAPPLSETARSLRAFRERHGLSRLEAARLVGRAWTAWQDWELDRRNPDRAVLIHLRLLEEQPGLLAKTLARLAAESAK